ncbi:J domain-containing protein [Halorarius litoreus]|uniref:J domain-containing protein n=1 Tax=Halorarius litoreus TaxID=2962676 RepID=UPI0020CC83B3|nr:DnaJ domain-containing protein [Halorarius litoreus]
MNRGWLLFGASALLAAGAVVVGVVGLSLPPLLLAALALGGMSYACFSKARDRVASSVYTRVGVEPNPDGTVGEEGARAERSRSGRVTHEPRDDWDDPDDWPFDDPFWTGEGTETDGGTETAFGGGSTGRETTDSTIGSDTGWTNERSRTDHAESGRGGQEGVRFVAPRAREACDVLGVDLDASPRAVRAAYRERVKETHPDRGGEEAAFKRVRWAYEYLREHYE